MTIARIPTAHYADLLNGVQSAPNLRSRRVLERALNFYVDANEFTGTLLDQRDAFGLYQDSFEFRFLDGRHVVCRAHDGHSIAAELAHNNAWSTHQVSADTWTVVENEPEQASISVIGHR